MTRRRRRRHPSVLGDDGVVPGWVSGICGGGCVARPVNGSLWHFTHMKVDGCCGWHSLFFRLALFSARILFLASSPTCTPFLTAKRRE